MAERNATAGFVNFRVDPWFPSHRLAAPSGLAQIIMRPNDRPHSDVTKVSALDEGQQVGDRNDLVVFTVQNKRRNGDSSGSRSGRFPRRP